MNHTKSILNILMNQLWLHDVSRFSLWLLSSPLFSAPDLSQQQKAHLLPLMLDRLLDRSLKLHQKSWHKSHRNRSWRFQKSGSSHANQKVHPKQIRHHVTRSYLRWKRRHCISFNFCPKTKNTHIVLLGFSTHHSAMARLSLLFTLLFRCHGDGGVAVCDDCLTVSGAGRSSVDGIYQKATPNAAHSWIDTSDLDIFWNYPPPRMPVTTRIVIFLVGESL